MNTKTLLKTVCFAVLANTAFATSVLAQPGPGMGGCMGCGPGVQGGGPGAGGMGGMGPGGMGPGGGRGMRFRQRNTAGWSLMTPEERTAHRQKMRATKTYDECKAVQSEQHKLMEARAKEKGITLPLPQQNACDRMKARGIIQ